MALLWAFAAVVAAVGAGLIVVQVRAMGEAAADLREQLVRLDEVRTAVASVRADAAQTADALRRLRGAAERRD
jgi:hypothetical protein